MQSNPTAFQILEMLDITEEKNFFFFFFLGNRNWDKTAVTANALLLVPLAYFQEALVPNIHWEIADVYQLK